MPRPPSRTGLDAAAQRELVWWLATGLGKEDAAKRAGLPSSGRLYHFMRTRQYADALQDALRDHLAGLSPKAVRILDEIMSDTSVNARVRVDAAKALLDRSGFSADDARKRENPGTELSTMTREDLLRLISDCERELAEAAKPVQNDHG